jgi:tetratricopeptide (TPR) repeat protein
MSTSRSLGWLSTALVGTALGLSYFAAKHRPEPFPPLNVSLSSPVARLSDFSGIALGFRALTADLAWIQTLLYYGTHEEGVDPEIAENGGGRYPLFLAYCQRVGQIDPRFKYVYYYGGAVLGWNLNRLDEAEILLKQGIQANPKEWRLQQFLAGLAYQKSHNINSLVDFLKVFSEEKDCPNILRSILAHIYKKQHRYREAIRIWLILYDSKDPSYFTIAKSQIEELSKLDHLNPENRP